MEERTKTEQNGVGITDELRNWMGAASRDVIGAHLILGSYNNLLDIADRIDERASKMYADLTIGMEPMDEEHMARDGWVKLPVDADGVPIRLGDEMELTDEAANRFDGDKHFGKVEELSVLADGWFVDGEPATDLRHVRPDSWERIIQDAIAEGFERTDVSAPCVVGNDELVERCRRLAER